MKEITMSLNQFMEMKRENISLEQIIKDNNLESFTTKIINDKKLRRFAITLFFTTNLLTIPVGETIQEEQVIATGFNSLIESTPVPIKQSIFILIIIICWYMIGYKCAKISEYKKLNKLKGEDKYENNNDN
jgi:hypothetical protein